MELGEQAVVSMLIFLRITITVTRMGDGYCWLRNTDSNRDKQIQRLSCYPYTIPQCAAFATVIILTHISDLSIAFP